MQMQKQDSSDKVQSRDKAMELLITLEPPLSLTELRLGCVSPCVSAVVTKNSSREPPRISTCVCVLHLIAAFFTKHSEDRFLEVDYG